MMTKDDFLTKERQSADEGFDRWLATPTVRLLISMIPGSDHGEVLNALLKEAFVAGHSTGSGMILVEVLRDFAKQTRPR